jgi:hypothetical protein
VRVVPAVVHPDDISEGRVSSEESVKLDILACKIYTMTWF